MSEIGFKTTNLWKIQGSTDKGVYISFVAQLDGWKKNFVFYKNVLDEQDEELFWFLWEFTEEERIGWTFLISIKRAGFMNNIYPHEIIEVRNDKNEVIFPWTEEVEPEVEETKKEIEKTEKVEKKTKN